MAIKNIFVSPIVNAVYFGVQLLDTEVNKDTSLVQQDVGGVKYVLYPVFENNTFFGIGNFSKITDIFKDVCGDIKDTDIDFVVRFNSGSFKLINSGTIDVVFRTKSDNKISGRFWITPDVLAEFETLSDFSDVAEFSYDIGKITPETHTIEFDPAEKSIRRG